MGAVRASAGACDRSMIRPCDNCPWRVGASTDTIPGFDAAKMQNLARACRDDGLSVMACHKSTEGRDVPCAGFVVAAGFRSIGVRLLVSLGQLDVADYATDGPLHGSFEAMLGAAGIGVPPRNRVRR